MDREGDRKWMVKNMEKDEVTSEKRDRRRREGEGR